MYVCPCWSLLWHWLIACSGRREQLWTSRGPTRRSAAHATRGHGTTVLKFISAGEGVEKKNTQRALWGNSTKTEKRKTITSEQKTDKGVNFQLALLLLTLTFSWLLLYLLIVWGSTDYTAVCVKIIQIFWIIIIVNQSFFSFPFIFPFYYPICRNVLKWYPSHLQHKRLVIENTEITVKLRFISYMSFVWASIILFLFAKKTLTDKQM